MIYSGKQPKIQIMILQKNDIVQYDACAERAKSICTYSVVSQAFDLV